MLRTSMLGKTCAMALAIVLVANATSHAQRRGGFSFGRGGGTLSKTILLRSEQVQKELNITEEQVTKIKEIGDEARKGGFRGLFAGIRDLSEDEQKKKFAEIREKMEQAAAEAGKKIAGVLNKGQNKRLGEISMQLLGTSALTDKEIAGKLKITDDQQQKIKDLVEAGREMQSELRTGLRDVPRDERRKKFEELGKKMAEIRDETNKAAMEVLTAEQKSQFEQMKGEKFELDRSALFRGFGRPRRVEQNKIPLKKKDN